MRFLLALVFTLTAMPLALARDLTPEVRARLFRPTEDVRLARNVVTIPMEGTDHNGYYECPYFKVYINGHGPFTFLFDTGAAYTLVSSRVVEAARAQVVFDREGHRDVVRLRRLKIGDVTLREVWAIHDDDFGVDGIIGFPAFGDANIMFDLAARTLTVSPTPTALPNSFELPYETALNVPTVPVQIGGRTVPILIDTGDDAYGLEIRQEELADTALAHPPVPAESVLNGATVQATSVTTLAAAVSLGPVHADSAVIAINDDLPVGDMGYDFLRQFRFEIQPARRVVVFQPLFEGDRFDLSGDVSPGFGFGFESGKATRVVPGSAAEIAGLATDDAIIAIDGLPPRSFSPRSWDERLETGAPVTVRWTHAGVEHEADFPLSELR